LNIKLVDPRVEKRVELGLGLAAWFDDERVHSWRLDFMAAEPLWMRTRSLEKGGVSAVHVFAGCR
jgi:hypothetical protein